MLDFTRGQGTTGNSIGQCLHIQDFTRFTFGQDLEWAAADFAIGRESLAGDARVNGGFKPRATERALDGDKFFHS